MKHNLNHKIKNKLSLLNKGATRISIIHAVKNDSIAFEGKIFFLILLTLITGIGIFNFWMAYPGLFFNEDTVCPLFLIKDNFHPVIISYLIQFLYWIFGPHVWCFLLLEIVPLYLGLFLVAYGTYHRFHSWYSLLYVFIPLLGNIFFLNFHLQSSTFSASWLFLLYAVILYNLLKPQKGILYKIAVSFIFIVALLSRHNAIFATYPVFLVWIFQSKNNRSLSFSLFGKIVASALLTIFIAIAAPKLLSTSVSYPSNHIFLEQMVGACAPSNDSSCFPKEWYLPRRSWEDVKWYYINPPLSAAQYSAPWIEEKYRIFKWPIKDVRFYWVQSIKKHPKDYAKYLLTLAQKVIFQEYNFQLEENLHFSHEKWDDRYIINYSRLIPPLERYFPMSELKHQFSPLQDQIYLVLRQNLPIIQPIYFICTCILLVLVGLLFLIKIGRSIFLIFSISASLGGIGIVFINCIFTPRILYRYIHSALILSILGLIGFILFLCEQRNSYKQIKKESSPRQKEIK